MFAFGHISIPALHWGTVGENKEIIYSVRLYLAQICLKREN